MGEVEWRVRESEALSRVADAVARRVPLAGLCVLAAREVTQLLGVEAGSVTRIEGSLAHDMGTWIEPGAPAVPPGPVDLAGPRSSLRAAVTDGRPSRLASNARGAVALPGYLDRLSSPIRVGGQVWGGVWVASTREGAFGRGAEDRIGRFTELLSIAIADAAAREALEQRAVRQTALGALGTLALSGASRDELFDAALRLVRNALGVESGAVAVADAVGDGYSIVAGAGRVAPLAGTRFDPGTAATTTAGFAMASGAVVVVEDLELDDRFAGSRAVFAPLGLRSTVTAPIRTSRGVWGVISGFSDDAHRFDSDAGDLMTAVANVLGSALDNDEVHRLLYRRVRERALLQDLAARSLTLPLADVIAGVGSSIAVALGVGRAAVVELDDATRTLILRSRTGTSLELGARMPVRQATLLGRAIAVGHGVTAADLRTEPGEAIVHEMGFLSGVAVPIIVEGHTWGGIGSYDGSLGRFTIEDRHVLESAAAILGTAIARDRSERQALRRAAQQEALLRIGARALGAPLAEAINDVAAVVASVLGSEHAAVVRLDGDEAVLVSGVGQLGWGIGDSLPLVALSLVEEALATDRSVVVSDMASEGRYAASFARLGARSGAVVLVSGEVAPWGCVGAFASAAGAFGPDAAAFLSAVANVLAAAVERDRQERMIEHQALHDQLTGLSNRTLLVDRLDRALGRAHRAGGCVAVVLLDLDGFKRINDRRGESVGDALLVAVGERLARLVRPGDTVARLGGDRFAVVAADLATVGDALAAARAIAAGFAEPFPTAGGVLVAASLGLTVCAAEVDANDALRDADTAMVRAKEAGGGRIEVFDSSMRDALVARQAIEEGLAGGVARGEFILHYQPVIDLETARLTGFEGLARWSHPTRGLLAPQTFISLAEETGAIIPLGRHVIAEACRAAARWNALRPTDPVTVTVNVSPRQLADDGLPGHVAACLAEANLAPALLGLEITESVLVGDDEATFAAIGALEALGVRLLLDDFGVGYASLGYLQRIPLDALKLDRSFVSGVGGPNDARDSAIIGAVVAMGRALGLEVVAEGIETPEQLAALRRLGCQSGQGYAIARPLAASKVERLLAADPPWIARLAHDGQTAVTAAARAAGR